jgi:hypothetical protein
MTGKETDAVRQYASEIKTYFGGYAVVGVTGVAKVLVLQEPADHGR